MLLACLVCYPTKIKNRKMNNNKTIRYKPQTKLTWYKLKTRPYFSTVFSKTSHTTAKVSVLPLPSPLSMLFWRPQDLYEQASWPKQHRTGMGRGQFVPASRCLIVALILENRRSCVKSFVRGWSFSPSAKKLVHRQVKRCLKRKESAKPTRRLM